MSESALAPVDGAAIIERVVIQGDLSKLSAAERVQYYTETCRSLGLNPLTRPFEYITLNGRLTLYATRGAGDQLRSTRGISVTRLERELVGGVYTVTAYGTDREGRQDSSIGAVPVEGLKGEALANAYMKAETKAKRRLTLSLAGLGWPDETEVGSIPTAVPTHVDPNTGEITRQSAARATVARAAAEEEPIEGEAVEEGAAEAPPGAEGGDEGSGVASSAGISRWDFDKWRRDDHIEDGEITAAHDAACPGVLKKDMTDAHWAAVKAHILAHR